MASRYVDLALSCTVRCSARMVRNDYGVPGSPVWYEPEDIKCDDTVEIEGVEVKLSVLPEQLQALIRDMAANAADDEFGWEGSDHGK